MKMWLKLSKVQKNKTQDAKIIKYDFMSVPTVRAFVQSNNFINAILGPVGSGKSSGCAINLLNRSFDQQPDTNGSRKTRWAIVRNTYQQLKDTTKKTIEEWLPFAKWKESENLFRIDVKKEDGTVVESEWMLRALDRPDQVDNLLSLELTGAWLNEARELPKEVFDMIQSRLGRYPKWTENREYGPTWYGLLLDTNPPDTDHWFYKLFEEIKPQNATLFRQASALSDEAENLDHLPENYYENLMVGKDDDFIKVYVHAEYGYLKEGKAVFSNFRDSIHVFSDNLKPIVGLPLIIGMDCALMPAAVITQMDPKGRLYVLDELQGEFMSAREFAVAHLRPLLRSKYTFYEHIIIGDPAGNVRSQVDSRTVYQELRAQGLKAKPAKTNALNARIGAVNLFLTRMVNGKPGFIISDRCQKLRKALNGAYRYRRLRMSGERYTDVPDKNEASHIADALQYACLEHETGFLGMGNRPLAEKYKDKEKVPSVSAWT